MPNVDIIQLKTICYIKIGFRLPQHFNSWSVPPDTCSAPTPLITQSHTEHNIGRISHYFSPSQLMRSHLFYNFWFHTVCLNNVYRCGNNEFKFQQFFEYILTNILLQFHHKKDSLLLTYQGMVNWRNKNLLYK